MISSKLKSYNPGQKSMGQSEHNCNSICITSNVVKSSAVILQIHVSSPFPTQYNVERSKELYVDGFITVHRVGEGVGTCSVSSARIQFCVCSKVFELYNCPNTFVHDCRTAFHVPSLTLDMKG